jgi:hypothetical protein
MISPNSKVVSSIAITVFIFEGKFSFRIMLLLGPALDLVVTRLENSSSMSGASDGLLAVDSTDGPDDGRRTNLFWKTGLSGTSDFFELSGYFVGIDDCNSSNKGSVWRATEHNGMLVFGEVIGLDLIISNV